MVNKYIFGIMFVMNFWLLNFGSIVIIRIIFISFINGKIDFIGVLGLIFILILKVVIYSYKCKNVIVYFCKKLVSKLFIFIFVFLIWFIKLIGLFKEKVGNIIILFDYLLLIKLRLLVIEKLFVYDSYEFCILEKWLRKYLSIFMNKFS